MMAENKTKETYKKLVDATFAKGYDIVIAPTMPTSHIPANHDFTKDKIVEDGKTHTKLVGALYTIPFYVELDACYYISAPAGLRVLKGCQWGFRLLVRRMIRIPSLKLRVHIVKEQ